MLVYDMHQANAMRANGNLATVDSKEISLVIERLIGFASHESIWIGANDQATEGTFVWEDGSTFGPYQNFEMGRPQVDPDDAGAALGDCVQVLKENGLWQDNSCSIASPAIYQLRKGSAENATPQQAARFGVVRCVDVFGDVVFSSIPTTTTTTTPATTTSTPTTTTSTSTMQP